MVLIELIQMQLFRRLATSLEKEPRAMYHRALPTTNYLESFVTPHLVPFAYITDSVRSRFLLSAVFFFSLLIRL